MDIFVILKKRKDGKTASVVCAFTVFDKAMEFAKTLKKMDVESEYTVMRVIILS